MENRLCLNKKPKYELPDNVLIGDYIYSKDKKRYKEPNFEPDICISYRGYIGICDKKKYHKEFWVKTKNKKLIYFIKNYNWKNKVSSLSSPHIPLNTFKKILLEEFYGVKNGE